MDPHHHTTIPPAMPKLTQPHAPSTISLGCQSRHSGQVGPCHWRKGGPITMAGDISHGRPFCRPLVARRRTARAARWTTSGCSRSG